MTTLEQAAPRKTIAFVVPYLDFVQHWIEPIRGFLDAAGYDVSVLHMHSLSYGLVKSDVVVGPEYELFDLGGKNARQILDIVEARNFAAMGFFNFQSWFELLLMRIAGAAAVPTFYMQHGRFNALTFKRGVIDKKSSARRYWQLSRKLVSYLTRISDRPWGDLLDFTRAICVSDYRNLKPDYALLFANESLRTLQDRFQFAGERVYFTGFPIVKHKHELERSERPESRRRTVLYLHQAFVRNRLSEITYEQEAQYLADMARMCATRQYDFVVKLHPRESLSNYEALLKDHPVRVELEASLADLVKEADLVIGQSSTALFCPILFRKPLVIAYYPGLKDWDPFFESLSLTAKNAGELEAILGAPESWASRLERYDTFIEEYVGPNNSYEYLAETIDRIATGAGSAERPAATS